MRGRGHIVVTGASSGIGEAIARAFGIADNRVTLIARRADKLQALASELGCEARAAPCDLSDLDAGVACLDDAVAAFGPVDALVNNAGIQFVEPAADVDDARAERLMTVNLMAPLRLTRRVLPTMLERGQGSVVAIASLSAFTAPPGMAHYQASKAAMAAYFETLRVEVKPRGVRVLTVYPGPVATPMERAARAQMAASKLASALPTGKPAELARRVRKAVERGHARLIYPRVYALTRHAQVSAQWLTNRFAPSVDG